MKILIRRVEWWPKLGIDSERGDPVEAPDELVRALEDARAREVEAEDALCEWISRNCEHPLARDTARKLLARGVTAL